MAKKLNKVFLNPTAEQIEEYQLIEGISWFTAIDAIADAIEADKAKKPSERVYTLRDFQIVDGGREVTANLTKIAKQTGFTLSNDLDKVIDYAKTVIDYDVDHISDHRVASTAADGKAAISDYLKEYKTEPFKREWYTADSAGTEEYKQDIADQVAEFDNKGAKSNSTIVGYQDLTLTNVGSKATDVEEGETYEDKVTTVTRYNTVDVKGGDFSFDYQYDAVKTVDKKDENLIIEDGKENAKISGSASGTLTVKDSVIGGITPSFTEKAAEIKGLHKNDDVEKLIGKLNENAGSFETVVIDNSTVQGNIQGGSYTYESTATVKEETFLDKPEESGEYYNAVSGETNLPAASGNSALFIKVNSDNSALTEKDAEALAKEYNCTVTVSDHPEVDNLQVNKYTVVSFDVEGNALETGKYVYITSEEFDNLSDGNKKALNNGNDAEPNVGWVDYSPDRVVTDANVLTFDKAPEGIRTAKNAVNKYVFQKGGDEKTRVAFYLTEDELGDKDDPTSIYADILKTTDTYVGQGDGFLRVASKVTVEDYTKKAVDAYSTISTTYQNYKVTKSMSEAEARELNKAAMSPDKGSFVWIGTSDDADEKKLFAMSKFTVNDKSESVETKYWLSASEMTALGIFGGKVTYEDLTTTAATPSLEGWAFTGNAVGTARVYFNDKDAVMYRKGTGPASLDPKDLADYVASSSSKVVTDVEPFDYQRYELGYTTVSNAVNKYVYKNALDEKVTYYLTAEELGNGTPGTIKDDIENVKGLIPVSSVENGGFLRIAPADTVDVSNYETEAVSAYESLKGVTPAAQFDTLVEDKLVGKKSQFVTVVDGEVIDLYQTYGYAATVTDLATVTPEKISVNGAEIEYNATVQVALWEGDEKVKNGKATLVDGIPTQNTNKYFDRFASIEGEYVIDTKATGEKAHEFITVAESRWRDDSTLVNLPGGDKDYGYVVTDRQAKAQFWDEKEKDYVWKDAYIGSDGYPTDEATSKNDSISYYQKKGDPTVIYALTSDEAAACADEDLIVKDGEAKPVAMTYFTNDDRTERGWFADKEAAALAWGGIDPSKVKDDIKQPGYRADMTITTANIAEAEFVGLTQKGLLVTTDTWTNEKMFVTEGYYRVAQGKEEKDAPKADIDHNYDRAKTSDGKDAFYNQVTGELTDVASTTYDAIYEYELQKDKTSVNGLKYYMTEKEAAKATFAGYPEGTDFVKLADDPYEKDGEYQYRISAEEAQDASAYLVCDPQANARIATKDAPKDKKQLTVNHDVAYNDITFTVGYQVYEYTFGDDTTVCYMTRDEALEAWWNGWGAAHEGNKVDGVVHYGTANWSLYTGDDAKKNFADKKNVYWFSESYRNECLSQNDKGEAVQAFNTYGPIWSNIDGVKWTDADDQVAKYSDVASDLCEVTYNYNYGEDKAWTTEQIQQIAEAEKAAGIATWKVSEQDGQLYWTRTSAIGEVSIYAMDYTDVDTDKNAKSNYKKEAAGSISVINGSEVKGTITGYLDVTVTDSTVQNVFGGDSSNTTTKTLSTSKGAIAKDNSRTITTKETEKTETLESGAGSFTISRTNSDKIYKDAAEVKGYENVSVSGVNTDALTATNSKTVSDTATQTTYQGDADALRSDYVEDWGELAFNKGIVSKIASETTKSTTTNWSAGTAEVTGRTYKFDPTKTEQATFNKVGAISGYSTVSLTNAAAGNIIATDEVTDSQTAYKVATKNNVDTATETVKSKTETKALAELTAVNTVTDPNNEADLKVGDIKGFASVTTENYSFDTADALGTKSVTTSTSSVREAVASDMRLVNAGIDKYGLPTYNIEGKIKGSQKYDYGKTTAAGKGTYANDDMSWNSDTTTKRTATATLTATGRAYEAAVMNYIEDADKAQEPVFAYTQKATGRTYYLTEAEFEGMMSNSKADKAQWDIGTKTVYYRAQVEKEDIQVYNGNVTGAQVVREYQVKSDTSLKYWLTDGEMANYNRTVAEADQLELVDSKAAAVLRGDNTARLTFSFDTTDVVDEENIGSVAGVYCYQYKDTSKEDQYLTEAEAAALPDKDDWTKDPAQEYVRRLTAGDDRTKDSVFAKDDTKVTMYRNTIDSDLFLVLTDDEYNFINDTDKTNLLADYVKDDKTTVYRETGKDAGLTVGNLPATIIDDNYSTGIAAAKHYVKLDKWGQVTDDKYVTADEFKTLSEKGNVLEGYVEADAKFGPTIQYQYRDYDWDVKTPDFSKLHEFDYDELYGWAVVDPAAEVYDAAKGEVSQFVLDAISARKPGNTSFKNIYGYKDVILTGMKGGNIFRVAEGSSVAADNETTKATYKKTIAKGSGKTKGKTTYTETDSSKSTYAWTADGSVTLTDSKVGKIAGYKTVTVASDKGTVEVGQISRTTFDAFDVYGLQSYDKSSTDISHKVVTEDSAATFKVTTTTTKKTTESGTAAGSVSLIGKRAGVALELAPHAPFADQDEAEAYAQAAIDAHAGKQFADVVITGGVIGYQDVIVENATITAKKVAFDGGKFTATTTINQNTVKITDNASTSAANTVTVMNKINDSSNTTFNSTGSLTLTNVNYADPDGYKASGDAVTEGYTLVNEYVFNGVTYALTKTTGFDDLGEEVLLPEGAEVKGTYKDVLRDDATITTPAVELQDGKSLQDIVNVEGVAGVAKDKVYYAATATKDSKEVKLFVRADQVNALYYGEEPFKGDGYTDGKIDTTVKLYSKEGSAYYTEDDFKAVKVDTVVKKYKVDDETTYFLTEGEAAVMEAEGTKVVKVDDKEYTRISKAAAPVTVSDGIKAEATVKTSDCFEYRGVIGTTGMYVSYYLTADEATNYLLGKAGYETFGKVNDTEYRRDTVAITDPTELGNTTEAHVCKEVKKYAKKDADAIYVTADEVNVLESLDPAYAGYKAEEGTFYRTGKAYVYNPLALGDKNRVVNESVTVYEVVNNDTAKTLGYLSEAEILALQKDPVFANYTVNPAPYLRSADDTTDIIKVNGLTGGYVIEQDLSKALYNATAAEANPINKKATATGFQTVTLTNAGLGDLLGGNHTEKKTEKLAAKKNSTIATYTTTEDTTDTATGSLTATNSEIGKAEGYDKVILTADKMDETKYKAGDIEGGKAVTKKKDVYTSQVQQKKADYSKLSEVIEYTKTKKETTTSTGSAELKNVVAGSIQYYKDVIVSFDEAIDAEATAKNQVGSIKGGNIVHDETVQGANLLNNSGSYSETTDKCTVTSVGTVTLTNAYVAGDVSNFVTATVTDSEITGNLSGGNTVEVKTEVDVNGDPALDPITKSIVTEKTITAAGKASVAASKVGGDIAQFKDVELTGGVEVGGNIIVGGEDTDEALRGAHENTPCYAVFFTDSDTSTKRVVYLTEAEYKVFVKAETSAMIDTVVSVYRPQPAMTDDDLKKETAVDDMKAYTTYTDDAVTEAVPGYGVEGKNSTTWIVKTAGNSLTIGEGGAKVGQFNKLSGKVSGGKVEGYANVTVSGDSSFGAGYFGTEKADKLTVDASLATFTTQKKATENPVGFDFGEGKDELVLNGTIGIQAAFKYDVLTGTNAWNLETVSGSGTIVCRTEDVNDVKAAFAGVTVVGTENYNAKNALDHQTYDDLEAVINDDEIADWLGFCNKADFFMNDVDEERTFSFLGDSVTSGDIAAQISIDGGKSWASLNNGDKVKAGAVVKIEQFASSTKASNDYTIAFK